MYSSASPIAAFEQRDSSCGWRIDAYKRYFRAPEASLSEAAFFLSEAAFFFFATPIEEEPSSQARGPRVRFGGKVIHPEMHLTGDFWAAGCIKILTVSKNDPDSNSSEQKKIA